jgi:hypothetical protein
VAEQEEPIRPDAAEGAAGESLRLGVAHREQPSRSEQSL